MGWLWHWLFPGANRRLPDICPASHADQGVATGSNCGIALPPLRGAQAVVTIWWGFRDPRGSRHLWWVLRLARR
ncbi:hypothetical protein EMEDMD4_1280042 [Sinorhizobium medicae]|uniref:Uncharacterized protein n=1 Tax=Sinorhizobium medicae TaxID=110321 RepID=A0A508WQR2_9HYPH|nr:hypothetical protein EMEDMD4_1280042 [Sinorhizobium medicae]